MFIFIDTTNKKKNTDVYVKMENDIGSKTRDRKG